MRKRAELRYPKDPLSGLSDSARRKAEHIRLLLEAAVPLRIYELRRTSPEMRQRMAHDAAQEIAEKGDLILFKVPKEKKSTRRDRQNAISALITGIACGAYQPGGIRPFGLHFEVKDETAHQGPAETRN